MSVFAPPLSVVLMTYNRRSYLQEAIDAILKQTYQDFELLILDNCSTDDTAEYVLGLTDPRVRYVRNAPNNCSVTFNGISAYHVAIGRRVIATHDDDIMENDMLERQMRFLDENPEVALVWCQVSDIDQDGKPIVESSAHHSDQVFAPGEYIASFLKTRLWPMPSGVMLVKAALPKSYGMESYLNPKKVVKDVIDTAGIEDVLFPARVNRKYSIGYIGAPLLRRRIHLNQFTHKVNLSRPAVNLYRGLERLARGVRGLTPELLNFRSFVNRYDIQEAITTNVSAVISPVIMRRINKITDELIKSAQSVPSAFLAGLPVFLLRNLIKQHDREALAVLKGLDASGYDSATQCLLIWAYKVLTEPQSSLLAPLAGRRIIIFGSAFIAALLVLDARKHGQQVLCCVDSNSTRHGTEMLGVPIRSPKWMRDHVETNDVVIMSSERDHEHYIEALIRNSLQVSAEVVSWKNLLNQFLPDDPTLTESFASTCDNQASKKSHS